MDSIIGVQKISEALALQLSQDSDSRQVALGNALASMGISAQKALYLPDASVQDVPSAGGVLVHKGLIMSMLWRLTDKRGGDALDVILSEAITKSKTLVNKVRTDQLLNNQELYRDSLQEKRTKLIEAQKQVEHAHRANRRANIWSKISGVLAIIGSVIAIGVGAMLVCTVGGAVLGAAMMASGALGIIMAADSLTAANHDGKGFLDDKTSLAFTIIAVALAIATLGFAFASSASAGTAAANTAGMAASATSTARFAELSTNTFVRLRSFINALTAATTIGASSAQTGSSAISIKASHYSERASELRADSQEVEAFMRQIYDFADIIIKLLSESSNRYYEMLSDVRDSMNDRAESLSRAAV